MAPLGMYAHVTPRDRIVVAHVITELEVGGAEMVLSRLLERIDRHRMRSLVISLGSLGKLGPTIENLGIPVIAIGRAGAAKNLPISRRVISVLRDAKPDVVQTWMYHADHVGGISAKLAGGPPIAWGLHAGPVPPHPSLAMRVGLRVNSRLSRWVPDRIVCCAEATRRVHVDLGYDSGKMVVIPNGFSEPQPYPDAGRALRQELGLDDAAVLIGRVGRWHSQKDHQTLIAAFDLVRHKVPEARLVLVGEGMTPENTRLAGWVRERRIGAAVHYLGARTDVDRLNAGFDVAVSSSSYGEAFPLVLGEAMAGGTPVVSTDVGDSALLINDGRRVVPPSNPEKLAAALVHVSDLDPSARSALGERDRRRVLGDYSLDRMVDGYVSLYEELARSR